MQWRWVDFYTADAVTAFMNTFTHERTVGWKVLWNEDFKVYTVFCCILESERI